MWVKHQIQTIPSLFYAQLFEPHLSAAPKEGVQLQGAFQKSAKNSSLLIYSFFTMAVVYKCYCTDLC